MYLIGGMFRGSRLNAEYNELPLDKHGVVYWMSNDSYSDVFVTSTNEEMLYIEGHSADDSSIGLDSSFGHIASGDYESDEVNEHILNTMHLVDRTQFNGSHTLSEYYIYYELQQSPFGSFFTVIVFPESEVLREYIWGRVLLWIFAAIAIIFASVNGCFASAVPLIPVDDSWLSNKLLSEKDKQVLFCGDASIW